MTDNKTVYDNYRASLRAQRKMDGGRGRTAARKQTALKLTADRYGIRIGEVKNIVREEDAKNGITHEHTENYNAEQAFLAVMEEAKRRLGESPCSFCNVDNSSGLVRPRFANKLDLGEDHMRDTLGRYGLRAQAFEGTPKLEDFIQLCYVCKLNNLGLTAEVIAVGKIR